MRTLDDIKAQIIKHYQRISDREAFVTAEMVRNAYLGIGTEYETLLGAFDKDNESFQEDKLEFPNLNYWNICKPLKKMIKECGISKDISFHCTRHGFAMLALSKGVPIESVSLVLGHTNINTTQRYAKITTEKIDKDLTMFGNRLNQSFSEISIAM